MDPHIGRRLEQGEVGVVAQARGPVLAVVLRRETGSRLLLGEGQITARGDSEGGTDGDDPVMSTLLVADPIALGGVGGAVLDLPHPGAEGSVRRVAAAMD